MQEDCAPIILDNEIPKGFKLAHIAILLLCLICIFNKLCIVLSVFNSQATFCISRRLESIFIMLRGSRDFSGGRTLVGPCQSNCLRLLPSRFVDSDLWGDYELLGFRVTLYWAKVWLEMSVLARAVD